MIREVKIFGPNTLSTAPESYNVSGVQRTAEVVRLFAKGFKDQRPLLSCELSVKDPDLDVCASVDSLSGNIYVWLVQRNLSDYRLDLDLSSLGIRPGTPVIYEQVGHDKYGEATILRSSANGTLSLTLPKQRVGLLTICPGSLKMKDLAADQCALVKAGAHGDQVFGSSSLAVELDARTGGNNQVSFIHFSPKQSELEQAKRIVLGVHGYCEQDTVPYRFHAYGMSGRKWQEDQIKWINAPCLDDRIALAEEVGANCFVAGELTMDSQPAYHYLDVTEVVKKHVSEGLTFMLIREGREPGDDYDKGRMATISSRTSKHAPILQIW